MAYPPILGTVLRSAAFDRKYTLIERIHSGGFGIIFKAEGEEGDIFAIKIPNFDLSRFAAEQVMDRIEQARVSFRREQEAAERLRGNILLEGIVSLAVDRGTYIEPLTFLNGDTSHVDLPFLVLQWIDGVRLEEWCTEVTKDKEFSGLSGAFDWFSMCKRMTVVVAGIHSERVIHGDIWPPNILIQQKEDGVVQPILIDFGKAWLQERSLYSAKLVENHEPYIAPELVVGDVWASQADLYSLGAVFFFLACGAAPTSPFTDSARNELKSEMTFKGELLSSLRSRNARLIEENEGVFEVIWYCLHPNTEFRAPLALSIIDLINRFLRLTLAFPVGSLSTIRQKLNDISERLTPPLFVRSPLFFELVQNAVHRLERNVNCASTRLYTLRGSSEEMLDGLLTCLAALKTGDKCCALLTIPFWTNHNFGVGTQVLSMLRMLARNNVEVSWLLVFSYSEAVAPETAKILSLFTEASKGIPMLQFRKAKIDDEQRRQMWQTPITCIYLEQSPRENITRHTTLITPYYSYQFPHMDLEAPTDETRSFSARMSALRFWAEPDRWTGDLGKLFEKYWQNAESVDDS